MMPCNDMMYDGQCNTPELASTGACDLYKVTRDKVYACVHFVHGLWVHLVLISI
jgi:hypothetical protein